MFAAMPARADADRQNLTPLAHGALNHCFGCGLENPCGLRLKFFVSETGEIVCHTRLARRFQGAPGYVHGGIIATLLDEAMSKTNRARGVTAVTRHLEVEYLRPVPIGRPITLTARHLRHTGRRHYIEAQIADAEGQTLASGIAVFVAIGPEKSQKGAASLAKG